MKIEVLDKLFSSLEGLVKINGTVLFLSKKTSQGDKFEISSLPSLSLKCTGIWDPIKKRSNKEEGRVLCSLFILGSNNEIPPIIITKHGRSVKFISNNSVVAETLMGRRRGSLSGFGIDEINYTFRNSIIAQVDDSVSDVELVKVVSILVYLHYSNCLT
jgi:hypothetical protein